MKFNQIEEVHVYELMLFPELFMKLDIIIGKEVILHTYTLYRTHSCITS